MSVQPFIKFEDGKSKVFYRSPTVHDYRDLAGHKSNLTESIVTEYLNKLQDPDRYSDKQIDDSAMWTVDDRRAALFWLFLETRDDHVITQSYQCQHCKKEHGRQIDLSELAQYMHFNDQLKRIRIDMDDIKPGFIQPLRGYAAESLEAIKMARDEFEVESSDWRLAHTDLRLMEAAWHLTFDTEDMTLPESDRVSKRYDYLLTLDPEMQFKPLFAKIRQAAITMRHGLAVEYMNGEPKLITPPHVCPNSEEKEGGKVETTLLLTFQNYRFLPVFF